MSMEDSSSASTYDPNDQNLSASDTDDTYDPGDQEDEIDGPKQSSPGSGNLNKAVGRMEGDSKRSLRKNQSKMHEISDSEEEGKMNDGLYSTLSHRYKAAITFSLWITTLLQLNHL